MTDHAGRPPIRVALRISARVPAYVMASAEAIMAVPGAAVVLVLLVDPAVEPATRRRRVLDVVDAGFDRIERWFLRGGPPALDARRFRPRGQVEVVVDGPVADQSKATAAADADVLIDLAPPDSLSGIDLPPAGRWTLCYANGVDGVRRASLARPSTTLELAESLLSIEAPSGQTSESDIGVSTLRRVGYGRDRDAVLWRSSMLPARRLARLVAGEGVSSGAGDAVALATAERPMAVPSARVSWPIVGLITTMIRKVVDRAFFTSGWIVLVRQREPDQPPPSDLSGFRSVEPPAGRFYADPFVVDTPNGPVLYVEDCPVGVHRGRISLLRSTTEGRWERTRLVLDDQEHRAYPHVIPFADGWLLSPDGGRSGGVDLFVGHEPDGALVNIGRCLVGVPASDPTVLWHDDRFWMFVTVTEHGMNPWDEVHLFSAATLDGLWHPHPRNPVVADVRRARPAGRIFWRDGALIRPGQDCSVAYGRRIVLNAITVLTPTEYEEHPIGSIEPEGMPGIMRTHTYTFGESMEALDGYRRKLRRPTLSRRSRDATRT